MDDVTAPMLLLHGEQDSVVPVSEAEQVVAKLAQRGVPVKFVLFPDEGHVFHRAENRIRATVEMVRWFAEYL